MKVPKFEDCTMVQKVQYLISLTPMMSNDPCLYFSHLLELGAAINTFKRARRHILGAIKLNLGFFQEVDLEHELFVIMRQWIGQLSDLSLLEQQIANEILVNTQNK